MSASLHRRLLTAAERERLRRLVDARRREQLEKDEPADPADVALFAEFRYEKSSLRQPWQRTRA